MANTKTIKVFMLRSVAGPTFSAGGGGVFDVPEAIAKQLLNVGYARLPKKGDFGYTEPTVTRTATNKAPMKRSKRTAKKK